MLLIPKRAGTAAPVYNDIAITSRPPFSLRRLDGHYRGAFERRPPRVCAFINPMLTGGRPLFARRVIASSADAVVTVHQGGLQARASSMTPCYEENGADYDAPQPYRSTLRVSGVHASYLFVR